MQRQTAADAVVGACRDVGAAVADSRRTPTAATDPVGTLAVGTLLALVAATVPVAAVPLVGYVITAARHPARPVSGFGEWVTVVTVGVRGTAILVGAALPAVAALRAVLGNGPAAAGPAFGPALGATGFGVAMWHCAIVGVATVALGGEDPFGSWQRLCRSGVGIRLSLAVATLAGTVGLVGFGLVAIPVVGPMLAAATVAAGVVIAGRLVGRVVAMHRNGGTVRGIDAGGPGRNRTVGPGAWVRQEADR